jgi:hypothetical protein
MTQKEAANRIERALFERGQSVEHGIVLIGEDEPWLVIEHSARCVGIDPNSGIWVGKPGSRWKCIAPSCSVSGALMAVEYLLGK